MVVFILVVLAAFGIGYLFHRAQSWYENKIAELERRLADLERLGNHKPRNPYLTNAGLEDAIAIIMDVQANHEYNETRLRQAKTILGQVRSDPSGYDEDRPNGKKGWLK